MKDVVQVVGVVFLIRCSSALPSEPEKHENSVLKWVQTNAWMLWRKKKELFRGVFQRWGSRHSSSPTAPPKALQFGPSSAHAPGTADRKRGQVQSRIYHSHSLEMLLSHLQGLKHQDTWVGLYESPLNSDLIWLTHPQGDLGWTQESQKSRLKGLDKHIPYFQYRVSRWNQFHPRFEFKMVQVDQPKMLGAIWSTAAKGLCPQKTPTVTEMVSISKRQVLLCGPGSRRLSVHHHHRHSVNKQEFAFT